MFTDLPCLDVLIDASGVAKLADFGTAKIIASREPLLKQHSFKGTPRYMPPEVVKSDDRGREGSGDIWSLGCVVLELSTGEKPWGDITEDWSVLELFSVGSNL